MSMRIKIKIGELHMNFDRGRAMSDQQTSESGEEELNLGDHGAGDDCITKVVTYGGNSALIGGAVGCVEGCFLNPIPGSTTPMLVRALGVIARRSILFGAVGGTFAAGACTAASVRDKDDYMNAAIGGMMAGSIFGFKHRMWSLGLGMAVGMAFVMGAIKFRHGTYLPPLPFPRTPVGPEPLPPRESNGD